MASHAVGLREAFFGCVRTAGQALPGGPAADMSAAMQQHFEHADDAHVADFDSRMAYGADDDRQGDPLQQREVDVNVEPLRLVYRNLL